MRISKFKVSKNGNTNEDNTWHMAICLLGQGIARERAKNKKNKGTVVVEMGRISADISDELEKRLRFKTIEEYGGKKGDLSKAVEEAIKMWVAKEKKMEMNEK